MNKGAIADTSCLIALDWTKKLDLIRTLYSTIVTTEEVKAEFDAPLPIWVSKGKGR